MVRNVKKYNTIISHAVLYECETWSLTLREHRLKVSGNTVLRRIFRPKRVEMIRGWMNMHNEELHLNSFPVIRPIKIIRARNTHGGDEK
jgi:hypothetical protein